MDYILIFNILYFIHFNNFLNIRFTDINLARKTANHYPVRGMQLCA